MARKNGLSEVAKAAAKQSMTEAFKGTSGRLRQIMYGCNKYSDLQASIAVSNQVWLFKSVELQTQHHSKTQV
ncbi:hypothetical protein GCM10007389_19190 [Pontibacter akesuensis]|nr:hypothetical protein GCM10007389_19190 [Pontibacter akesuensis]